ncbi:DNA polymerase III subunit chi [Methylomonas sp. MS20]|uniref:DNA polymerase III subunit chi n=1 Tax=unclassified Methylomonas TaxID=2608980 RepID=UPI0028A2FE38|nr:DNA polymerase III subunit chi [Methylomonas sp. MV1]MDT4330595.1 DNA polymerase III subunit chi [Methylomonas sp. MV1]
MTELGYSPAAPEVSFYVLSSHDLEQRHEFACKLIEKIYRSGRFCYVLTDSAEQAELMDKHLWTFRPGSFVPHQRYSGTLPSHPGTILIGVGDIPENWRGVIVNLSADFPPTSPPTERILEILDNSEASKQAGRQRYRRYQQLGLTIQTHKM